MSRILRAAGAAGLALALLAPAAAYADGWSGPDQAGDVRGWHYDPEPEPCGTDTEVDGSAEANEDITRLGVRHTRGAVVITTRFVDLDPGLEQAAFLYMRTNLGGWWLHVDRFERQPGNWRMFTFLAEEPDLPHPDDIESECGAVGIILLGEPCRMARTVDFDLELIRLRVPRSCIGNPRWVRVGVTAHRWIDPADPEDRSSTTFYDDWDGGVELSPWAPPYGPRVRATRGAQMGAAPATSATTGERRRIVVRRDGLITRR